MTKHWASSCLLLLLAASVAVGCGSGAKRQLQSMTITAVSPGGYVVYFTAIGTYNTSPTTVNPLPTSWYVQDPTGGYQLTTQPFVITCDSRPPGNTVTAMAPVDPDAPSSGSTSGTKMIVATAPIVCL